MSIERITRPFFRCTDGKEYDNPIEAEQHQALLDSKGIVEEFLTALVENEDYHGRSITMARNILLRYEQYRVTHQSAAAIDDPALQPPAADE